MTTLVFILSAIGLLAFLCDLRDWWRGRAARRRRLANACMEPDLPPIDDRLLHDRTEFHFNRDSDDAALPLTRTIYRTDSGEITLEVRSAARTGD